VTSKIVQLLLDAATKNKNSVFAQCEDRLFIHYDRIDIRPAEPEHFTVELLLNGTVVKTLKVGPVDFRYGDVLTLHGMDGLFECKLISA
jgi:hypothetical protein